MSEECLLVFNAIPFMKARYYIHTGYNGLIYLPEDKKELGYILAHKLTDDIDEKVYYYKPDMKAMEIIFGKNIDELNIITNLDEIKEENHIVIIDSSTVNVEEIINKLNHYIIITQSNDKHYMKGDFIYFKIDTTFNFLNNIELFKNGRKIRVIL